MILLGHGALVLARGPHVREKGVVSEPQLQRQLGHLVVAHLPHRSNALLLGDLDVDNEQHHAHRCKSEAQDGGDDVLRGLEAHH